MGRHLSTREKKDKNSKTRKVQNYAHAQNAQLLPITYRLESVTTKDIVHIIFIPKYKKPEKEGGYRDDYNPWLGDWNGSFCSKRKGVSYGLLLGYIWIPSQILSTYYEK